MTMPPDRPFHHLGLAVDDLRATIEQAVSAFGAGPFFVAEHVSLPTLTHRGRPALGFYALVAAAVEGWDSSDPARPMPAG